MKPAQAVDSIAPSTNNHAQAALARASANAAAVMLIALIFLCLGWELWLAPLREGGSWLALKALPLLLPLFGVLRERRYTFQWSSMFILLYFCEGVVRAWSEHGTTQALALAEILFAVLYFVAAVLYARYTRTSSDPGSETAATP